MLVSSTVPADELEDVPVDNLSSIGSPEEV